MITITEARKEHVEEIVELWKQLMEIHINLDPDFFSCAHESYDDYRYDVNSLIDKAESEKKIFVALSEDKVVGYVTILIERFTMIYYNFDPFCVIGDIMIHEDFRKHKIGERFIEEAKRLAKDRNVRKLMVNVYSKNEKSYSFFKHIGFQDSFHKLTLEI
jgi:GNAT superfamily N-acetyltransferase